MRTQTNAQLTSRFRVFSRICAVLVFLVGCSATAGWQFDVEIFKRVAPSFPVIAPNTAFFFILIGAFVFFLGIAKEDGRPLRMIVGVFSIFIAFLGVATLVEYIFKLNFGIDGILFSQKMGANIIRMSPQSALNFFLVGLAIFLYSRRGKKSVLWGQIAIVAAGVTALISLFGFIYGVSGLYTIAPYKGMAAHTAAAFTAVFFGILTARPEAGFVKIFVSRGISAMAARRLLLALFAILLIEIFVMLGGKMGFFGVAYESLIHLLIVASVFVFLIFFSFRSLDRLIAAEESLEHLREVDRAKTEFVSLASHQLRTPLTSVSWFTEMLVKKEVGPLNPKQNEYLNEIFTQNRRMIDLVDDLLNSSRIEMGMLNIEPKTVDLRSILKSVIEEMDPLIKEKDIIVEENFEKYLPDVRTDPEMARVVFQNIISNAVKYTPVGGKVTAEIALRGPRVEIKVADTGYGIPKSQQGRVFTKMFRADNIRNKVTDGTGLGLFIAKSIMKELGGKIHFESKEGKGTTFFVSLSVSGINRKSE
jgi:signal transduction histidine kinase